MTTSSNDNVPEGSAVNAQGPRSSLSLGGGRLTGPIPDASADLAATRDMLAEGATRARNMAHALVMIVYLVAKLVLVKIAGEQLRQLGTRLFLLATRVLQAAYLVLKPHLDRLRAQAHETTNKAWRTALVLLIAVVGPAEELVIRILGIAKAEAAKLAARGTRSAGQVLAAVGKAITQAIKAGLSRPAAQKLTMKVIRILEDAHL